jgi:hypothetical protein
MEGYAYQARDPELAGYCAEVKKRALRRLSQLMKTGAEGNRRRRPKI